MAAVPEATLVASLQGSNARGVHVEYRYPEGNLGDWNACIALYADCGAAGVPIGVGDSVMTRKRLAFKKITRNKPNGHVTFSARDLARYSGRFTFVLLLDSICDLGWRCLARTPPLCLAAGGVPELNPAPEPFESVESALLVEDEMRQQIDDWLGGVSDGAAGMNASQPRPPASGLPQSATGPDCGREEPAAGQPASPLMPL